VRDEGAAAGLSIDQPFRDEHVEDLPHRDAADAIGPDQLGFGRQAVARLPLSQENLLVQYLIELVIQRQSGFTGNLVHQAAAPSHTFAAHMT